MRFGLLAQAQLGDQRGVTVGVLGLQVIEQLATAAHHAQQAATAVVVLGVRLEVGGELVDAGGQQCDLHFGAAGVVGCAGVVLDDFGLDGGCDHWFFLCSGGV
eukprot:TRINITY_DN3333_c0_g1_i6.p2 TRINITY_DN3333_c0_g1~~TRINITY_DN3333_c0_g1_i6.p2  ORF type:complete len:103 (-),score=19.02 TRINITY_DN3333_c0_g1_i6:171-479(-)